MYVSVVFLHSVLRWVVLALGLLAVLRALRGQSAQRPWTSVDTGVGLGFTAALDVQLLLGAVLFVKSPITILGMHELDLAFSSSVLRFFTFVHPLLMLVPVVLAHVARVRIRREAGPARRHRHAAILFGIALVLLVVGTPWPFLPYGRPLLAWLQ